MLVRELLESVLTTTSALDQLINNANKMYTLYADTLTYQINNMYALGEHEDMGRMSKFQIGRFKGKWFTTTYLSTGNRGPNTVDGFKNAITVLTKDPRYNVEGLQELGSFTLNMNSKVQADKGESSSQYVTHLESLPQVMLRLSKKAPDGLKERLETTAVRLGNAINSFYSLWKKLHKQWEDDWGPNKEEKQERDRQLRTQADRKAVSGSQNSQVEQIINQVLNSIDKRAAAEIRPILARSDNKLAVLQQELSKRGIKA